MKLSESNAYMRDPETRKRSIEQNVRSSTAIEEDEVVGKGDARLMKQYKVPLSVRRKLLDLSKAESRAFCVSDESSDGLHCAHWHFEKEACCLCGAEAE